MSLSPDRLERFARHIVLPEVGGVGQARLAGSHVLLAGLGGIGAPALQDLAAAGVGRLTLVDDDAVDLSNLQRQVLFETADAGEMKAERAATHLHALNPHVETVAVPLRLEAENVDALLAGHDLIIDGCDSFTTRLLVADAALAAGVPLVSGAVGPFDGQVAVFKGYDPALPCYRCFVGNPDDQPERNCAAVGVLGALTGVIGSLMAMEAIRELSGFSPSSAGRITLFDAMAGRFRSITLPKDPACSACSAQ
jgi:adenylyltransferase/sulfurtransferase